MRLSIRSFFRNAALALLALLAAFAADARAVTMSWSPVGNAGNAADPATGSLYGAVGYSYNIGTYDVTVNQYVEFLNAKDRTGTNLLDLYNSNMSVVGLGGINFTAGNANGSKYSALSGDGNHPVNFVSWYDTIRFANWMNNGQGNSDTETGAYTLGPLGAGGVPIHGASIARQIGATVILPSENEWYKAAYNIPGTNSYNLYPTSSNTAPTASGPTALPNHANYNNAVGNLTDIGAHSGTTSPYGAFDMGGNVSQWDESLIAGFARAVRGGSFADGSNILLSSTRGSPVPTDGPITVFYGFRLANIPTGYIPEPSSLVLAALGFMGLAAWRLRRR